MSEEHPTPIDASDPETGGESPSVDRRTLVKALVGFAVAGVLLYLLGSVVGWARITNTLV